MTDKNALFEALKPFLGPVVSHEEVKAIIDLHVAGELPHDFRTHQHSWRNAIELCVAMAKGENVDFHPDDASYWAHELRAFDGAFLELGDLPFVSPEDMHAADFVRIVEDLKKGGLNAEAHAAATKTDRQIVDEVNAIAHVVLRAIGTGYRAPEDHLFWKAEDPRSQMAWSHAVEIYEMITAAEVFDALMAVEEDEETGKRDIIHLGSQPTA